jgi:hypothetical protein
MKESNWMWVDGLFNRFPLPYPIASAILACILMCAFIIFAYELSYFDFGIPDLEFLYPEYFCPCPDICGPFECVQQYLFFFPQLFSNLVVAFSMSLLVSFELFAIKNLLNSFKAALVSQKFDPEACSCLSNWHDGVKTRFTTSPWKHLIVLSIMFQVFFSFYKYYSLNGSKIFFFSVEIPPWGVIWGGMFDIFNRGLYLFSFYLLALILWILINISWSMVDLGQERYRDAVLINIINPDNFCELNQYKNLVLKGFTFFFVCISLAALTDPSLLVNGEITYLNESLIVLFPIGLITSLVSIITIEKINNYKLMKELLRLNELYKTQYESLMNGISNGTDGKYNLDLAMLTAAMKALHEEKERIISKNRRGYDFKTIGTFIASFLLPVASKIIQDFFSRV